MANPKNKKTISILVRDTYEHSGAEARDVIVDLFQFFVDNAPEVLLKYPKLGTAKEVLNFG